ncbi:hypothetical protein [Chitinophaga sp. CF418]|uniref:hypothetical protein n=1 Tax=Chitinophaga sp. CF418 TaxID=1855287 RepID=UPI000910AED5|nr:hypothetical protein [Chitinophaga sp. CF418]SHN29547.1 hypothetical protein SAMN05216311_108217 [Chitinophaga sp. CF418]
MKLSDNAFYLSSGLILRQGSKHGNRFSHFVAHFANDLKKGYHGVFKLRAKETVVEFLDEAWTLAKAGGSKVAKSVDLVDGRTIYIVDMGWALGYEGGKKARKRH